MPKHRHQIVYAVQKIGEDGTVEEVEVLSSAKAARAVGDALGLPPERVDLCVLSVGFYAERGGPLLPQSRRFAYWRLGGKWSVPTAWVEGGSIPAEIRRAIAEASWFV